MQILTALFNNLVFILALLSVFACVSIVGWLLFRRTESFLGDYEEVFKESATKNLGDMFLFIDPQQLFLVNIVALVLVPVFALMLTGDGLIALVAFLMFLVMPFYIYRSMRRKRLQRFEKQLPDALVMISGSLSSGASLNMALDSMVKEQEAPLAQEFMLFLSEQRIGVEYEMSLRNMERRTPLPDFLMFTAALRISREVGGNLGEVLTTLAETLRRKAAMEGKIESLTSQGRLQGIVMTGLPVLLGGLLFFLEPVAMGKLFTTPVGWGVLSVILVMETLGYVFIRKVTSIDV